MPRKGISGTGITAREVTLYDVQRGESLPKSFWEGITESFKKHGHFGMVALEAEEICNQVLANFNGDMAPVDSPEAFAQIILKHIAIAKDNIGHRDDADYAARHAFEAGFEWARATMKWAEEGTWLTGKKSLSGAKSGHEVVHGDEAAKRARWQAMIADLDAELSRGTKKTAAYAVVAEKHGVSAKTVQRARRYLKS